MEIPNSSSILHTEQSESNDRNFLFDIATDALVYEDIPHLVTPDDRPIPSCPIQSKSPVYFDHNNPLMFVNIHYAVTAHGCHN